MADQFDALVSGVPTDADSQKAIAAALRRQSILGQMYQTTGDRVIAPLGEGMQQQADTQAHQIGQERQAQAHLAQTLALQQQEMKQRRDIADQSDARMKDQNANMLSYHRDALAQQEELRQQGLDIQRQKMLDAEAAKQAGEGPSKGDAAKARQSLDTVKQLRALADQVDKDPGAIKPTADATMSVLPTFVRGTGENMAYNEKQQEIRTNGQLLYQVMRKQLDGLRPNAQLIAQAAQWEPFQAGDDAKRTSLKLRNAANHLEGQANAVLNTPSKLLADGQAVDWDFSKAGTPDVGVPSSKAETYRNQVRSQLAVPTPPAAPAPPTSVMFPQAMGQQPPRLPTIPGLNQGNLYSGLPGMQ